VVRFLRATLPRAWFYRALTYWPTYWAAGIRVVSASIDARRFEVELRVGLFNQNYVGTAFGGSLYAMCDPWFMFTLLERLGPEYIVWDKAASIQFKKPGRGRLRAVFELSEAQIEEVRQAALKERKVEPVYRAQVLNERNEVVAEVEKVLYVRRKQAAG
jgi:acyl-coenzyme A thioesterase PaaI-like protein